MQNKYSLEQSWQLLIIIAAQFSAFSRARIFNWLSDSLEALLPVSSVSAQCEMFSAHIILILNQHRRRQTVDLFAMDDGRSPLAVYTIRFERVHWYAHD